MQALRLASRSLLRAWINNKTLYISQGNCVWYKSTALLGRCEFWQKGNGLWEGRKVLYYHIAGTCYEAPLMLDARRAVLMMHGCKLELRRSQDCRVALWIAQHVCVASGQHVWQRFVDDLYRVKA